MGYTTHFDGQIQISPPLSREEVEYLNKFSGTRRMNRQQGPYYVDGSRGILGRKEDPDHGVLDYNSPPAGQPGLWCQWVATDDGTALEWDGGEKFYDSPQWMQYLIDHFIGPRPRAAFQLPFLKGHNLNGVIDAQGEESSDRWRLIVRDSKVYEQQATVAWIEGERPV